MDNSDKDLHNEYYEINQGDLIKLGRMYIKIREICINRKIINKNLNNKKNIINRINTSYSNNNFNNYNNSNHLNNLNNKKNIIKIKNKKLCRVCYCDDKEINSPLISPCKCIGGLKYIHLSCLINWIEARAILIKNESNNDCLKYEINQVNCEICQEPYPDYIYNNDKEIFYEIFNFIQMKFNSYIIIETIPLNNNLNDENNKKREIFILSFDTKDSIFIGRSHSTDMRLNDITVSRYHSKIIINKEKNKYFIRDMGSKFGTGILIQNNKLKIYPNFPLYIQISKCTVLISIKKICNFFYSFFSNCCYSNEENKLFKYYGKFNSESIEIEKIFQFKQLNEENIDEDNNCDYSNNESITEKTLRSKNSDRIEEIKLPIYKTDNVNNNINENNSFEKFNLNKNKNKIGNIIINNTEATLMGTFLSNDNSHINKTKSFIKKGKKYNIINDDNNQDIKTRIMRKIGKFSVNSEQIEENLKEENNNNNFENKIYDIDEKIEENSKNSKNSNKIKRRFKGKKGLQVSSISLNKSIGVNIKNSNTINNNIIYNNINNNGNKNNNYNNDDNEKNVEENINENRIRSKV